MDHSSSTDQASEAISARAARFVANLNEADLPSEVAEKARNCILYGLGVGMLCLRQPMAQLAERAAWAIDGEAGARGATSLASGRRVSVSSAIFANAALLHSRCQEDTLGTAHLGVVTVPVALAMVEAGLADARDMVAAIVAGYEVAGALEGAFGRETMAAGVRASPLYGTLAAAATAARLLKLTAQGVDAALANAAAFTGGTMQTVPEGSDEWRYQVGVAARTGVLAACLAQQGSISAHHSIEGPQGFALAYVRRAVKPGELNFGAPWKMRDVSFKPYPICAHNQTVTLLGVQAHERIAPQRIAAMRLRVNPYLVPGMMARGPFSRVSETLLSAYFCCATACVHGTVTSAQLADFNDPAVAELMKRITIETDPDVPFPSAMATVETTDGSTIELMERRSFADFSLGRAQVNQQLHRLATEEGFPVEAMQILDAFAFGLPSSDPAEVRRAYALARPTVGSPA